jgi:hypothetical protein
MVGKSVTLCQEVLIFDAWQDFSENMKQR